MASTQDNKILYHPKSRRAQKRARPRSTYGRTISPKTVSASKWMWRKGEKDRVEWKKNKKKKWAEWRACAGKTSGMCGKCRHFSRLWNGRVFATLTIISRVETSSREVPDLMSEMKWNLCDRTFRITIHFLFDETMPIYGPWTNTILLYSIVNVGEFLYVVFFVLRFSTVYYFQWNRFFSTCLL